MTHFCIPLVTSIRSERLAIMVGGKDAASGLFIQAISGLALCFKTFGLQW